MKRIAVLMLLGMAVAASADEKPNGEPPRGDTPQDKAKGLAIAPPTAASLFDQYTKNHERVNGTQLRISAETATRDRGGPVIRIRWEIDYTGPRPPLIILAPSLDRPIGGATTVTVIYADFTGVGREIHFHSGVLLGRWWPSDKDFVTAKTGEKAKGAIDLPVNQVEEKLGWTFKPGDTVYVVVIHNANQRGDRLAGHRKGEKVLDAWTGTLPSNPVKVTFTKDAVAHLK